MFKDLLSDSQPKRTLRPKGMGVFRRVHTHHHTTKLGQQTRCGTCAERRREAVCRTKVRFALAGTWATKSAGDFDPSVMRWTRPAVTPAKDHYSRSLLRRTVVRAGVLVYPCHSDEFYERLGLSTVTRTLTPMILPGLLRLQRVSGN